MFNQVTRYKLPTSSFKSYLVASNPDYHNDRFNSIYCLKPNWSQQAVAILANLNIFWLAHQSLRIQTAIMTVFSSIYCLKQNWCQQADASLANLNQFWFAHQSTFAQVVAVIVYLFTVNKKMKPKITDISQSNMRVMIKWTSIYG